ncbi:Conserved_hypothetical protein [Hexamita inflata]|uniref:Uncharacterized protein n=1 Tax=Hexamita inflata TaxID=28002 RepID=A0AA86QME4_9EUKA|nr:Conserved hypothetical protein [Hexamita inflata]
MSKLNVASRLEVKPEATYVDIQPVPVKTKPVQIQIEPITFNPVSQGIKLEPPNSKPIVSTDAKLAQNQIKQVSQSIKLDPSQEPAKANTKDSTNSLRIEKDLTFYAKYFAHRDTYGNFTPKFKINVQEAVNYRFKVPQCAAIENSIFVSGRFDTEIVELRNNKYFYNQVNLALYIAEIMFQDTLNTLQISNISSITQYILLLLNNILSIEPLNKIPKTVIYVFVDSVINKACIEQQYQLQYFEVMKQVFASESFIKLIFKYPADKENYESKVKQAKAYSAAQEGNYQRQYCEHQARTLMFNVIDEQVKSMNPRSLLFEITEDMTADQKQYKLDLIETFFVGLSKFVSILTIKKFIQIDRFIAYATSLLRFNYNAQFVDTKNMYEAESLNANVQFNEKFSFDKFQIITFKQQISLLNQCLPDLFWFADAELVKTYKNTKITLNEKQKQALQSVLQEEFHANYIIFNEEQLTKFAESKNCDDILPVKRLQAFIDARKQIVNDFTKYVVPFYQFMNTQQKLEIDELQFNLSKQFKGVNNAFYNQVQAFKSKNSEIEEVISELNQGEPKKKMYKIEGNYIKTIAETETKTKNDENKQMKEPVQSKKQKLVFKKIKKE